MDSVLFPKNLVEIIFYESKGKVSTVLIPLNGYKLILKL